MGSDTHSPGRQAAYLYDLLGSDDISLAEFPLASICKDTSKCDPVVSYERLVKKGLLKQKITIESPRLLGMPNMSDLDVLLAIIAISKERDNFQDRIVPFSCYRLRKIMLWPHNGQSDRRINDATFRWQKTNIEIGNWYNSELDTYHDVAFSFFSHADMVRAGKVRRPEAELPCNVIEFSEPFHEMLRSGFGKDLDLAAYYALSSPAAKQAFRFLDKRLRPDRRDRFDLRDFALSKIGMTPAPVSRLIDRLERPIRQLEEAGLIAAEDYADRIEKVKRGQAWIYFRGMERRERLIDPIALLLTNEGVEPKAANQIVADKSIPHQRIREKIEMLHWFMDTGKPRDNPAGWLRRAIEEDWEAPAGFETSEQIAAKARAALEKQRRENQERIDEINQREQRNQALEEERRTGREKWQGVVDYLRSLGEKERGEFIRAAVAESDEFFRDIISRDIGEDFRGWEQGGMVFQTAVYEHLERVEA